MIVEGMDQALSSFLKLAVPVIANRLVLKSMPDMFHFFQDQSTCCSNGPAIFSTGIQTCSRQQYCATNTQGSVKLPISDS